MVRGPFSEQPKDCGSNKKQKIAGVGRPLQEQWIHSVMVVIRKLAAANDSTSQACLMLVSYIKATFQTRLLLERNMASLLIFVTSFRCLLFRRPRLLLLPSPFVTFSRTALTSIHPPSPTF